MILAQGARHPPRTLGPRFCRLKESPDKLALARGARSTDLHPWPIQSFPRLSTSQNVALMGGASDTVTPMSSVPGPGSAIRACRGYKELTLDSEIVARLCSIPNPSQPVLLIKKMFWGLETTSTRLVHRYHRMTDGQKCGRCSLTR